MRDSKIEQYLQEKNIQFAGEQIRQIEKKRMEAIQEKDEEAANYYWRLAVIYYVQSGFVSIYQNLKRRAYAEAWEALKQTDLQMMILHQNYAFEQDEEDSFHLGFIMDELREYEKLFPYEYFICREKVIKKQRCTICGKEVSLRDDCGHVPGKIYMGEVCVHEPIDFEYLSAKATRDPFDKMEYLEPYQAQDMQYNFGMLDGLMASLKSPYEYWEVEVVKEKNPQYAKVGRNDKCPCGSGKKFKFCCMNDESKMTFEHYKIRLLNEYEEKVDKPLKML